MPDINLRCLMWAHMAAIVMEEFYQDKGTLNLPKGKARLLGSDKERALLFC